MPSPLIADLCERYKLPTVDATSVDAFLAPAGGECPHALLFFTGDPATRNDTNDVAVVLPELLAAFPNQLRAAIVAREAEAALMPRFQVQVLPSLAVLRGQTLLGVMPRIRDWSDYLETIAGLLKPDAPALVPVARPRVEITHNGRRTEA